MPAQSPPADAKTKMTALERQRQYQEELLSALRARTGKKDVLPSLKASPPVTKTDAPKPYVGQFPSRTDAQEAPAPAAPAFPFARTSAAPAAAPVAAPAAAAAAAGVVSEAAPAAEEDFMSALSTMLAPALADATATADAAPDAAPTAAMEASP